jgi:transposase
MKAYSIDLREKIVTAYLQGNTSIRKVAVRFTVSKSLVQKLVNQQRIDGIYSLNSGVNLSLVISKMRNQP